MVCIESPQNLQKEIYKKKKLLQLSLASFQNKKLIHRLIYLIYLCIYIY